MRNLPRPRLRRRGRSIALGVVALAGPRLAAAAPPQPDPMDECRAQIEADANRGEGFWCAYGVARLHNRFDDALALIEEVLERDPTNPWAHDNLAGMLVDTGQPGADDHYERAVEGYAERDDLSGEIWVRMSYADYLSHDDLDAARHQLHRARERAQALGDETLIAISSVEWARNQWRRGEDIADALRLLRKAEPIVLAQKYYQPRLTLLHTKSRLLAQVGRDAEAIETLETAIELSKKVGDDYVAATTLMALVTVVTAHPDLPVPEAYPDPASTLRTALELAEKAGNPHGVSGAHCMLGGFRADDPREHYEQCLSIARKIGDPGGEARALQDLALLDGPERIDAALVRLDQAMDLMRSHGGDRLDVVLTRALLLWDAGRHESALATSLSVLDGAEALFSRQLNPLTRAEVLGQWSAAHYVIADRILASTGVEPTPEGIDLALRVVERLRTRVLIERMDAVSPTPEGPLADSHREAVRRITALQRRLLEEDLDGEGRKVVLDALDDAEHDESALADEIVRSDPQLSQLHGDPPPTLAQIQAALGPDEAVLSFQLPTLLNRGAPEPWPVDASLFVITKQRARSIPIPERRTVEPLVDLFAGLFEARDGSEVRPAAGLYRDLVAPAIDGLPPEIDRLVVVPDGPLHRMPFAALRAGPSQPPLAERFALTITPSLRLWLRLREREPVRGGALVFADPELPRLNPDAEPERAWALSLAEGLGPLPHARAEAEAVARRLGPSTELHVGAAATEADVKAADLEQFAVLHFASHALLDDTKPERAAIVLAPGSDAEDGLLQSREIRRLPLAGAVVVLASCRSGSGTVVGGEGPIGLGRAFFLAGARTVVASLWRVRDDDSEAFFAAFYRHLDRGLSVSEAVQAAQNDRRAAGADAAAWAGFVVLGDGGHVPFPANPTHVPLGWVLLTLLAVAAGTWTGLRRLSARR